MNLLKVLILLGFTVLLQNNFAQGGKRQLLEMKNDINIKLPASFELQSSPVKEKKKTGLAVLYSLLLPGMGELYAGNYSFGKYFTIADGIAWGVVAGFSVYGKNREEDYKAFAKTYAGVNPDDKDSKYFADISVYENITLYNNEKELYRKFDETYDVEKYYWNWETDAQRKQYRTMWVDSEAAYNNVRFAVGALIVNRIISAIVAARSVSAYNKKLENDVSWNVYISTQQNAHLPSGLTVNFRKRF